MENKQENVKKSIDLDQFEKDIETLKNLEVSTMKIFKSAYMSIGGFIFMYTSFYIGVYKHFNMFDHISFFIGYVFLFCYVYFTYKQQNNYKLLSTTVINQFTNFNQVINNNPYFKIMNEFGKYEMTYPLKGKYGRIDLNKPLEYFTKDELEKLKDEMLSADEFEFIRIIDKHLDKFNN
jgi:hypothetical protein